MDIHRFAIVAPALGFLALGCGAPSSVNRPAVPAPVTTVVIAPPQAPPVSPGDDVAEQHRCAHLQLTNALDTACHAEGWTDAIVVSAPPSPPSGHVVIEAPGASPASASPPPPIVEEIPPPPRQADVEWVPGVWRWEGGRWTWHIGAYKAHATVRARTTLPPPPPAPVTPAAPPEPFRN